MGIRMLLFVERIQILPKCANGNIYLNMSQERQTTKKRPAEPLKEKVNLKESVMQQLKALKPLPNATPEQAVEALVKQAQFYTNFLLSKHDVLRKHSQMESKRRGHFEQEDQEIENLIEEEEQEEEIFTRLTEQPENLKGGQLKYYQLVGLNWLISLYESGISGILADDMGLGKTIQTISILAFIRQYKKVNGPHIIIAPKITLGNWMNQFQKWLPEARVTKLIATRDEREEILSTIVDKGKFDVIVTSFEGVRLCLNSLKKIKWHYIVIDEAHKIKNEDSQLSQVVRKLHTECKLLLTGTPLQNNLHELWSLLNFLLPEIFSNSELFDNWFDNSSGEKKIVSEQEEEKKSLQLIGSLHKILKPFMLRRTKAEVEKSLPPKKEVLIHVGLTDLQLEVYRRLLKDRNASQDQKKYYLNLLMQLRKVCNHPYLFPNIEPEGIPEGQHLIEASGKLIILDRLLKKLYEEGNHKVLIFSQMTMVLDILQDYCNLRLYKYCRIDGSTDMTSREMQIDSFMAQGSDQFVFLLSTRAGGLGINLTAADTVIIYDSDFNPQMDLQAMDRAHRIGQKNMVNVYRLITEHTVEEKIVERQRIKLGLDSIVIQQQKNSQKNKALTKEEIKEMLQFGANFICKAPNGTITDEQIDDILARGESKTNAMNKAVEERMKMHQNNLVDFSMNSINIFEFMQQDEKRKREDAEALDEILAKELQAEYRTTRREKAKPNYSLDPKNPKRDIKAEKKYQVPDYQFYQNRDLLQDLMQKEQQLNSREGQGETLNEQEQTLKKELLATGFRDWSKNDFNNFVTGCEKYGRKSYENIAKLVGKSIPEVQAYSVVFWERFEELVEKERILKQITNGEEKISNRKLHQELLQWKASRCYEIEFNPTVYTKFRSKLFSIDADRFLAQNIYKHGIKNMSTVREQIRVESMFRFDHYLRSRTESELNKRMLSIYKLIEKEKDNEQYGLDHDTLQQTKKKQKKRKQEEKAAQKEREGEQDVSRNSKKKNRKGKQDMPDSSKEVERIDVQ